MFSYSNSIKSTFKQTQWKTANPLWESGANLSQSFHHFFGSTFPSNGAFGKG
jgi:hypothetical protein